MLASQRALQKQEMMAQISRTDQSSVKSSTKNLIQLRLKDFKFSERLNEREFWVLYRMPFPARAAAYENQIPLDQC
jgi:hypothetical protein